jgi:hypothetical protein
MGKLRLGVDDVELWLLAGGWVEGERPEAVEEELGRRRVGRPVGGPASLWRAPEPWAAPERWSRRVGRRARGEAEVRALWREEWSWRCRERWAGRG